MTRTSRTLLMFALLTTACSDSSVAADNSSPGDSSTPDALSMDVSVMDTSEMDAGSPDSGAPTSLEGCMAEVRVPGDEVFEEDRFFQLMDFSNEELGLRMRVAVSPGPLDRLIGLAINYKTRALAIESADGLSCTRDEAQLTYEVTQHNGNDVITASVDADTRYVIHMAYDWDVSAFTDTLTIEHPESGAAAEGPFVLQDDGCSVHMEDEVSSCTYQIRPTRE